MNNDYLNRPLYPPNDFPPNQEQEKKQENISPLGNLSNLFSSLSQGSASPLLSLLLGGMNGGSLGNLSSILSGGGNTIFETLTKASQKQNKKESDGSPKNIPTDEIIS